MIIVLDTPQMPENIGAVARVMKNFGLYHLRAVMPKVPLTHPNAIATSAGAEDILNQARVFASLEEAIHDMQDVWGTCDRDRTGIRMCASLDAWAAQTALKTCVERNTPPHIDRADQATYFENKSPVSTSGIVFGCERTGLSKEKLSLCCGVVSIPTVASFSSLNLSHAVGITVYAYHQALHACKTQQFLKTQGMGQQKDFPRIQGSPLATRDMHAHLFQDVCARLEDVGYWRDPSKKEQMKENLANLLFRLPLTVQDISTLFGVFKDLHKKRRPLS